MAVALRRRETPGAAFHTGLALPETAVVIDKGTRPEREAYSAFEGTGLAGRLREAGAARLWVGGLALDYCVRASVVDALGALPNWMSMSSSALPVRSTCSPATGPARSKNCARRVP